jgi:hypothetical protein
VGWTYSSEEKIKNANMNFLERPHEQWPFGRSKHSVQDNIKMFVPGVVIVVLIELT